MSKKYDILNEINGLVAQVAYNSFALLNEHAFATDIQMAIVACETKIKNDEKVDSAIGRKKLWSISKLQSGLYHAEIMNVDTLDGHAPVAWWTARSLNPATALSIAIVRCGGHQRDWEIELDEIDEDLIANSR